MSSATSIDRADADGVRDTDARGKADVPARDSFKPWHFFVLASLLAATAAVVLARQSRPEHLVVISLTIGAAGFAGAALFRTLLPLVRNDPAPASEPLTGSMRAVLEREKLLVLRSIKELEFDRAMGKVSPKDFDEMAGRLRARAMTLMRQLDAEAGYRELIERELSARMRRPSPAFARQSPAPRRPSHRTANNEQRTREPADSRTPEPANSRTREVCVCGTVNDRDAAFCKRCGTKLGTAAES